MIITSNGIESFKIQVGDFVLAFNPVAKESKFKPVRFGADIVCLSMNHPNFNGWEQTLSKNKKTFVIEGAGEYEVEGIFIKGYQVLTNYDGQERINTVYSVMLDNITLGFLGVWNSNEISNELKEELSNVDILFIPIGGGEVLDAADAYKLSLKLNAKLIIPMHYEQIGESGALQKFLKESGNDGLKAVKKITLKNSDLANKEGEVVVLESE